MSTPTRSPANDAAEHAASGPEAIIPRATYRLQLSAAFTLRDATALIPYLADLGVSHVYCSPYFRARAGSAHGYDVVDHNSLNPEIGTREDLDRFVAALRQHEMGHIVDFVPNHVGITGVDNIWWQDVLENGEASPYAQFFDIDWQSHDPALAGKVLAPVLADYYGNVLERGELDVRFDAASGSLAVFYQEHRFPLDPRDYPVILGRALSLLARDSIPDSEREEFSSLSAAFGHLPDRRNPTPEALAERHRDGEVHKRRLARLCSRNPALAEAVASAARAFAGSAGDPAAREDLDRLLESQAYRLAHWRVAADEINYRRFFDVNDLAALRMENEAVFEATHALVLDLVAHGSVDGLRIDHPDGLYDPAQYFRRLQRRVRGLRGPGRLSADASPSRATAVLPLYVVAEKITAGFEHLPQDWAVHGTTGYRFANVVNGLLVNAGAKSRLDRIYRRFIGEPLEWGNVAYQSKRLIVATSLAAELNVLANQLARIARATPKTRDFTLNSLRQALAEIVACFPVYRTYIAETVSVEDRRYIEWALAGARRRTPAIDAAIYEFVRCILVRDGLAAGSALAQSARALAQKLQQVTAPVTAKGVEDTAFYRFNRLASLNEVGGQPDTFGTTVRAFHGDAQYRARHWPHELLATSTHDTKRSEDVRARINVLSEMPGEWRRMLSRWSRMNRTRKRIVDEVPAPSANDEYLLYQTLIGSWPLEDEAEGILAAYRERIESYMIKAVREAKIHSSWSNVNVAYEEALKQFLQGVLAPRPENLFLTDVLAAVRRIGHLGLLNSLAQTLCKLTVPGVPDTYQGTEIWDFSLVDPDNRRPVDYDRRKGMLDAIKGAGAAARDGGAETLQAFARALVGSLADGRAKLYVIWRALELRRTREALFTRGQYLPLRVSGARRAHVCAFARRFEAGVAVTVVPRLNWQLLQDGGLAPLGPDVWADTRIELPKNLPGKELVNVLDRARVAVREADGRRMLLTGEVLASFPVALLSDV